MILQICLDLPDQIVVVRAVPVEPENRRGPGVARPLDREPNPVAYRQIFRLAGPPDIAGFDVMLEQHVAALILHPNDAGSRDLERLVMRTILFGFLRHQTDVADVTHRRDVERAVLFTVLNDLLINAGVTAVRNHRLHIVQFAVRPPHLAGRADRGRHRRIDDDVARHVQVRDALVRIDHRECRLILVHGREVSFDFRPLGGREVGDLLVDVADPVVHVDTELFQHRSVLRQRGAIIDIDCMPENDRVGDFHHRRFHMQRKQNALRFRIGDFAFKKFAQQASMHHGAVHDLAFEHRHIRLQHFRVAVSAGELDRQRAIRLDHGGLLVREKVTLIHVRDVGQRIAAPLPHRMRIVFRILLDRRRHATVRVAFAQHRIHRTAEHA